MAKAKAKYTHAIDMDTMTLTKTFTNGHVTKICFNDLPEQVQKRVIFYGLKKGSSDCHSGANTVAECIAATEQRLAAWVAGDFTAKAAGRGGVAFGTLVDAIAAAYCNGDRDVALGKIEKWEPTPEDSAATAKMKLKQLRRFKSDGKVQVELDKLLGRSNDLESLFDATTD